MPINDMLLSRACMADSFSSPGIDLPSPTLSARLRELGDFLAAPAVGRLTEEQRAMALGVARRLVVDVAATLGQDIDIAALWRDWLLAGLPSAERLAAACFARAEEHRWREHSAQRLAGAGPPAGRESEAEGAVPPTEGASAAERAYLDLQIAERRRYDAYGSPNLPLADIDGELLRAVALDIAAWRRTGAAKDGKLAAELADAVRAAVDRHDASRGIDRAARAWHGELAASDGVASAATAAIARHDWAALIALMAAASRRSYADTALTLLAAESAALPLLLAPLKLDRAVLAPLEASLAMLPARAVAGGGAGHD